MSYELLIYNPSHYDRGGYVTIPWHPIAEKTGYAPDKLTLYQDPSTPLFYQIDQIDPANPSRDTLSFFLSQAVTSGPEDYSKPTGIVTIDGIKSRKKTRKTSPEQKPNIELHNTQMDLRLNLTPESEDGRGYWYAGSARSIRLENLLGYGSRAEYLDSYTASFNREYGHDPEKRCLQLESIRISDSDSESDLCQQIYLFNQYYRLVSECKGPVRHCITVASKPFYYSPRRSDGPPLKCELFRIFSLYQDRDYLFEELFINTESDKEFGGYFGARYFTYMRMDVPHLCSYESVPDWFSVTDRANLLGYGFATDVHVDSITSPHPGFPDEELKGNTFSWQLRPCKAANCLHLFSRFSQDCLPLNQIPREHFEQTTDLAIDCFKSRAGKAWYEVIYKPLRAEI